MEKRHKWVGENYLKGRESTIKWGTGKLGGQDFWKAQCRRFLSKSKASSVIAQAMISFLCAHGALDSVYKHKGRANEARGKDLAS